MSRPLTDAERERAEASLRTYRGVVAARLSEDPDVRVLLLEAGPADDDDNIHIPLAFSMLFRTKWDWNYETTPQKHLDGRRAGRFPVGGGGPQVGWPEGRRRQHPGHHRQPGLLEGFDGVARECGDHRGHPFRGVEHHGAVAVPDGDPALHLQGDQRLGQCRSADAQLDGQLAFGRQPVAR